MVTNCGTAYCTMTDFGGTGFIPLLQSVVNAIPEFFSITLFAIWVFGSASSYFTILKTTGRKRFWNSLVAMSFVSFLSSLLIVAMNNSTTTYLSGYWVGFYILMTVGSWYMMSNYK